MLRGATAFLVGSVILTAIFLLSRSHALNGAYVQSTGPVPVRSGPNASFRTLLEIQPGARVRLENARPDTGHYAIQLPDGSVGYITQDNLSLVHSPGK
jgi:uncharacterized protein YgiM (DUF1202 family)